MDECKYCSGAFMDNFFFADTEKKIWKGWKVRLYEFQYGLKSRFGIMQDQMMLCNTESRVFILEAFRLTLFKRIRQK